jgi:hypothetical protein
MAMNVAPLHCSRQGASKEISEFPQKNKKIFFLPGFFRSNHFWRNFAKIALVKALLLSRKKTWIHIFGFFLPQLPQQKWVQWPELLLYLNSTHPIQYLTAIWFESATKNFWKKTMYSPLLSNFHFGKSFKRP